MRMIRVLAAAVLLLAAVSGAAAQETMRLYVEKGTADGAQVQRLLFALGQNMEDTEKELAAKKQYCEEMFKKGTDNPSERDEILGELKTISTEILTLEKKMSQLTELWHKNQEALRTANMAMHSLPGYEEPEETTEFILHIPEGYRVDIMTDNPSVIS